jgi:hypothetical protein
MIWRVWALAHGRARRLLDRLRAFETPQDVTAKAFGKQACADTLRGPQKSGSSRAAPRDRYECDIESKAVLKKAVGPEVLGHTSGCMRNNAR